MYADVVVPASMPDHKAEEAGTAFAYMLRDSASFVPIPLLAPFDGEAAPVALGVTSVEALDPESGAEPLPGFHPKD